MHRFTGKHAASESSQGENCPEKATCICQSEDKLPVVSYFNDVRIPDVKCSKIKPPEGYTFITSALKVTSDAKYAKFYDENNSPDSCNVTDWYM